MGLGLVMLASHETGSIDTNFDTLLHFKEEEKGGHGGGTDTRRDTAATATTTK